MVHTQEQFEAVRARLEDERRATEQEIQSIDDQMRSFGDSQDTSEGVDNHLGDDSDVVYEQERLMTLRGRMVERRYAIQQAFERIEAGTYGYCENCGQPIAPERLEALPFVSYCIQCQELQDRRREGRR